MPIYPVPRHSLTDVVAGKLAASVLNGSLKTGSQLPPERELMQQLAVSRSTLREALKVLADNRLIDSRQGVGWFVLAIDQSNLARASELAGIERDASPISIPASTEVPTGPRRLPVAPEKPLRIPNLRTDRLASSLYFGIVV